jgi:hypothetical protein
MACAIRTIEDLRPGRTPKIGSAIHETDAINLVRLGGDVIVTDGHYSERKGLAERIARMAGTGVAIPFESGSVFHHSTPVAGKGTLAHFHPADIAGQKLSGHVFIDNRYRGQSPSANKR